MPEGRRVVRLHPQAEGGDVLHVQVPEVLDRRDISAARGEVAGELQARLPRGRLVLDDRERTLGAFELFPAAEPPVVLAFDNLIQPAGRT